MPKIDRSTAPKGSGAGYPSPHDAVVRERTWVKLGDAAGLTRFGVNLLTLKPGVWSSQRHWHTHEDEFVYVLEGEVVLVDDDGEHRLGPGEAAGFKAEDPSGHHFINRSEADAVLLVAGSRHEDDSCAYPDIDMALPAGRYDSGKGFTRKDGTPY